MKNLLLNKIRLSYYFSALLILFVTLSLFVDKIELGGAALTLFSANSFLYGFYISPIVSAQRKRMDELNRVIEIEASKIYEIAMYSRRMEQAFHEDLLTRLATYCKSFGHYSLSANNKGFDETMTALIDYKGEAKDEYKMILRAAFTIQQNRSEIHRLLAEKVYKNEWIIMTILFAVTIIFIMIIELPALPLIWLLPPIICAGLSMLIVILVKMSALTHKRAKQMWTPFKTLVNSDFRIVNN